MSKFAKTAIAAAMVMGAVVSASAFAAGNNGTARFYGTIEDSPCSIVPDDHKLEVDLGNIGAEVLKNNGTTTPKDFQIRLQDCVFETQTNMETTFTGNVSTGNENYYTIFNTDTGAAFNNVSLAIGDKQGTSYKSGAGIKQAIVNDSATNKGKPKQTLNFKAWLVGATGTPDLGGFEANTTFQITYL
ncbi:fimbrial protein [Escherichia coli]|uniref:Type 1 fimbrial protein n=1 Tax=Escherichia coli TaxID=562 RepID=A0A0L7AMZ4_ECOLX|nr:MULTISPECIES: fimbrial protein [Escherichia]EHQ5576730.1 fimbrial protein [Escherichia coli O2]EGB63192.1 fimbrial protein [Escherichia coli M863]EGE64268.1 putative fimbrial subunit [Escherichia coli STEC_7v]EGO6589006.1 fimbrial protein [Escherichia coli]EGO7492119.1 fimbrial protein [Escherichia coli]